MKRKRFTEEQMIGFLNEHVAGLCVKERHYGTDFLPLEEQIWRPSSLRCEEAEVAGGRECPAEEAAGRSNAGQCRPEGISVKGVVKPAVKCRQVDHLVMPGMISQRRACGLVGLSRSVAQYRGTGHNDSVLRQRLKELAEQYPRYGYLMLHALLRNEGLVCNSKRNLPDLYRRRASGQDEETQEAAEFATTPHAAAFSPARALVPGLCVGWHQADGCVC